MISDLWPDAMPELPEYKLFALWLTGKLRGIEFDKLIKCRDYALGKDPNQPEIVKTFNDKCNKILESVVARGKELAFVFQDGSCLRVHLALGGYFVVKPLHAVKTYPFCEHLNFVLRSKDLTNCLFFVEAAQFPNFITIDFTASIQWDLTRSPDLVSEAGLWTEHLENELEKNPQAFNKSLFEVMHDKWLFNGLGAYTINETLERLYQHYGVPPITNAFAFLSKPNNVKALRILVSEFVRQIIEYIGTDFDCSRYLEQEWLDFSNLFLLVFRKDKCGKNKVHCYSRAKNKCYTTCALDVKGTVSSRSTNSSDESGSESGSDQSDNDCSKALLPPGWKLAAVTKMTEGSLNVGMFHWYSATARAKLHWVNPTNVIMRTTVAKQQLASKQGQLKRKADSDLSESPQKKLKEANPKPKKPVFVDCCFDGVDCLLEEINTKSQHSVDPTTLVAIDSNESVVNREKQISVEPSKLDLPNAGAEPISPSKTKSRINRLKRKQKKYKNKFCKIKQKFPVSI